MVFCIQGQFHGGNARVTQAYHGGGSVSRLVILASSDWDTSTGHGALSTHGVCI